MQRNSIARLRCPYTASTFDITSAGRETGSAIEYGVVSSEGGQFPIVAGVLRLLNDELRRPLLDLVGAGRYDEALKAALEVPFLSNRAVAANALWRRTARRLKLGPGTAARGPGKQRLFNLVTQSGMPFTKLVAGAGAEGWTNWQTLRFSMPTFLPVYPLAHLATGAKRILDFGCGLAHSAFLMRRVAPDAEIICADYSFTSMYLGKRFLVPDAEWICLDGDYPLPFQDRYFDCVFSTDALQYIEPKVGLAREFRRIMSADGTIVLAHLHNSLSPGKGPAGKSLTPAGYHGLFDGMSRRLWPEERLVADYVSDGALYLDRASSTAELNGASGGLSLVAANTDAVFTPRTGLLDTYIDAMRRPGTNPAYRAVRTNGSWTLDKTIGAPFAIARAIGDSELLPQSWQVDTPGLSSQEILTLRTTDRSKLRELVRRFVVLELPDAYVDA
jgi:SAM-dependent methyltransferase